MNIENATAEELREQLKLRIDEGYRQYCLYPEGSVEKERIFRARSIPMQCFMLLTEIDEDPNLASMEDTVLEHCKQLLKEEQEKLLKELELSKQFLNGEMECTIKA